ncbi:MAG: hypothetical protein HYX88_03650 [Chloroflexi bacterium]|nr:hypothetical protein [Chloroflexota bacterium]
MKCKCNRETHRQLVLMAEDAYLRLSERWPESHSEKVVILAQGVETGTLSGADGVYQAGVIRVVFPSTEDPDEQGLILEAYAREGPLLHEMTHWFLDQSASGNYPRWFSEGMATYFEAELLGFTWWEEGGEGRRSGLGKNRLEKTEGELEGLLFEDPGSEKEAYRLAQIAFRILTERLGEKTLLNQILRLREGVDLDQVLYENELPIEELADLVIRRK